MALLVSHGATKELGKIIVPEHINKIKARLTRREHMLCVGAAYASVRRAPCKHLMPKGSPPLFSQDFYALDEGPAHPLPSKEFMAWRAAADEHYAHEQTSLIPGM